MAHPRVGILKEIVKLCRQDIEDDDLKHIRYITWNPKNNNVYRNNGYNFKTQSFDEGWVQMLRWLKYIKRCSKKYCILPEVSENGKLHCHGWFVMSDKIKWMKFVQPLLFRRGMIRITKLKEMRKKFDYYMQKDLDETVSLLDDHDLICLSHITHESLFGTIKKRKILNIKKYADPKDKPKSVDMRVYFDWDDSE